MDVMSSSEALRMGPQARRRIGTSSEALRAGPRARQRISTSSKALWAGPRARWRIGTSSEALRFHFGPSPLRVSPDIVRGGLGGPAEPRTRWGLASSCLLASIFTGSKRFFRSLLRGPLFMVPDKYGWTSLVHILNTKRITNCTIKYLTTYL